MRLTDHHKLAGFNLDLLARVFDDDLALLGHSRDPSQAVGTEGFEGKLSTSKYALLAKCSTDTALRDIGGLLKQGILIQEQGGGRNTSYSLILVDSSGR